MVFQRSGIIAAVLRLCEKRIVGGIAGGADSELVTGNVVVLPGAVIGQNAKDPRLRPPRVADGRAQTLLKAHGQDAVGLPIIGGSLQLNKHLDRSKACPPRHHVDLCVRVKRAVLGLGDKGIGVLRLVRPRLCRRLVPRTAGGVELCCVILRRLRRRRISVGILRFARDDRLLRLRRRGRRPRQPFLPVRGLAAEGVGPYGIDGNRKALADQRLLAVPGAQTENRLLRRSAQLQTLRCRVQLLQGDENRVVLLVGVDALGDPRVFLPRQLQPIRGPVQLPGEKIALTGGVAAALRLPGEGRGSLRQGRRRQQTHHHQQRQQQTENAFGALHARILLALYKTTYKYLYTTTINVSCFSILVQT